MEYQPIRISSVDQNLEKFQFCKGFKMFYVYISVTKNIPETPKPIFSSNVYHTLLVIEKWI